MASSRELQEAYNLGVNYVITFHRECRCEDEDIRKSGEFWARKHYPVQTQPRVVTVSIRGWNAQYRIMNGVIETYGDAWYGDEVPEQEWRPSEAFALVNGRLYVDSLPSEWVQYGLKQIEELMANPTEEVDG